MSNDTESDSDEEENRAEESPRGSMADVDHTHPHTGEPFSATGTYDRGDERTAADD